MSKKESINIIMLLQNFYKYKWSVLIIIVSIFLATFIYIKKITPIFSSNILISVESDQTSNISLFQNNHIVNVDMEGKLEYDKKILKSRHIISKVLKKIDFSKRFFIYNKWRDSELYQDKIPFTVNFSNKSEKSFFQCLLKISDKNGFLFKTLNDNNHSEKYYTYGQIIHTDDYQLVINKKFNIPINADYRIDFDNNENHLISNIIKNITIEKQANKLLKIHYEDRIPHRAKDVVSQLVKSYKDYNLDSRQRKDINNIAFLDQAILDVGKNLKKISNKIKIYRTKNSELLSNNAENEIFSNIINKKHLILNLTLKLNALKLIQKQLSNGVYSISILENNNIESSGIKQLFDKLKNKEEQLSLFQKQKNNFESLIIKDSFYSNLLTQLRSNQMELKRLSIEYTDKYIKVKRIKDKISAIELEMSEYIYTNIDSYTEEIVTLKENINKILNMLQNTIKKQYSSIKNSMKKDKNHINSIPQSTIRLEELQRAFELNEKNYKKLLQKRSEALISKESTISNIQIVDTAMEPIYPIKPKKYFLYLSGLIIGLFLSIIYTSFRTFKDQTIYNKEDISLEKYSLIHDKSKDTKDMIWILISQLEERLLSKSKIILITSYSYKENKKSIFKQLSFALDEISKNILIIDFDFYKPSISRKINRVQNLGLSNLLTSKHDLSEINLSDYILPFNDSYKNIDILPSGPIIPNGSRLLFNSKMKNILKELSTKYDYILIDSTPIEINPTINILFEYIDALVLIAEIQTTDKKVFQKINEFNNKRIETFVFLSNTKQRKKNDKHN